MDRLTRGFHRLGLVVAVPLAIIAVLLSASGLTKPLPFFDTEGGFFGTTAMLFALLWYAACRAVAWIINGFRETA